MAHLRAVLSTPHVGPLLATSLVGRLPTAMAALAILLLVRDDGGTYTLAGGLAALVTVGTAVGQPALARIVDRRGQSRVLLTSAAASSVAFGVLAVSGAAHPVVSGAAAIVCGLATPPLEPCLRALWPVVVGSGPRLQAVFSLDVGAQEVVFVAGPLLTTLAVGIGGGSGGVVLCAITGAVGTLAFAANPVPRTWRPLPRDGSPGSPLRQPVLVRVFVTTFACALPVGALAVVAAAFADEHGVRTLTGWTLAANAAGALAAGLYCAARPVDVGVRGAALALAVGYVPLALPLPVWLWLLAAVGSGLALPVLLGAAFATVQRRCPPGLLTEANAWVVTAFGVGLATATFAAGAAVDGLERTTAITVVVLAAAALTAAGALTGSSPRDQVGRSGPERADR